MLFPKAAFVSYVPPFFLTPQYSLRQATWRSGIDVYVRNGLAQQRRSSLIQVMVQTGFYCNWSVFSWVLTSWRGWREHPLWENPRMSRCGKNTNVPLLCTSRIWSWNRTLICLPWRQLSWVPLEHRLHVPDVLRNIFLNSYDSFSVCQQQIEWE